MEGLNLDVAPEAKETKKKKGECTDNPSLCAPTCSKRVQIMVDHKEGEPNFEKIGVNGHMFQVMRGIPVNVPGCAVHVLENATETYYVEVPDPNEAGKKIRVPKTRCAIPWRRV